MFFCKFVTIMKISSKIEILISFSLFCFLQSSAQNTGCPSIDLGPDTSIACSTPCLTLNASILDVGLTNTYTVDPLNYAPPYPFNQGTAIFVNLDDVLFFDSCD